MNNDAASLIFVLHLFLIIFSLFSFMMVTLRRTFLLKLFIFKFPQLGSPNFSADSFGQLIDELDSSRVLVGRCSLFHEGLKRKDAL